MTIILFSVFAMSSFCPISLKFDFGCKDKKNIWNANKYYEKHPLLGAADRATLYAFVARKQPHGQARDAFLAHLSLFQPFGVQFLP